ncbi:M23 family metallopeptidase [Rudaeicoccus suwonensis]|uniref:Murein DD-endopeptidase MepM/ murein hydrolase activator NlpD n=1 Tax=Rudaeicoccus suwonensis TaxID=657409 RepID=A0A561E1G8_9MICO|nr:M23 family metallopeptidase [Rudaeicoccus suwonensis]TWE09431.1 murein DD-endopeptidase MepM/ murein hydrolase activator NlpD [Rudaeicoccus suwonensis]
MSIVSASGRTRTRVAGATVVAALLLSVTAHASADDPGAQKKKVDKQIQSTQADLDDTSAQLIAADANLKATDKKVDAAQTTLDTANANLTKAQNHSRDMNAELAIAKADETKNQGQLATNTAAVTTSKGLVAGLARQSYMAGGLGNFELTLDVLTAKGGDVGNQLSLADIVMRQQNGVLSSLDSKKAAMTASSDLLGATRRRIADLTVQAANAVTAAQTAQTTATTAHNALVSLQKTQTTQRNTLQTQKNTELASLKTQQAESSRLAGVIKARNIAAAKAAKRSVASATAAPPSGPSGGGGVLVAPGPIGSIVSPFGWRINPVLGVRLLHEGDDFPYPCGTPVHAAAAGTVVDASYGSVEGNFVMLDNGFIRGVNIATVYEHMERTPSVRVGQHVGRGQLLGYSGTTGRSTGCHLHFGVMVNGVFVNPVPWIS